MSHITTNQGDRLLAYGAIGLGILLLIAPMFGFSFFGLLWPLLVLLPGGVFLYYALTGGKKLAGLAVPGAIIGGTGLILFYQNLTGHWESWAYIWSLYPVFLGMALQFMGRRTENQQEEAVGRGFVKFGLIGFAALWVLFEVLIFGSVLSGLGGFIVPALMIAMGVLLLRGRGGISSLFSANNQNTLSLDTSYEPRKRKHDDLSRDPLRQQIDEALEEIETQQKAKNQ